MLIVGGYSKEILVGIGAIKIFNDYAEIKRMYFTEDFRGTGLANKLLTKLEVYAAKKLKPRILLETGYLTKSSHGIL